MRCFSLHTRIQDNRLTAPLFRKFLHMVHHKPSISHSPILFICDNTGQIAGRTGHPECREKTAMAEAAIIAFFITQEKHKAFVIRKNLFIYAFDGFFIINIVIPQFLNKGKCICKILLCCLFYHHNRFLLLNNKKKGVDNLYQRPCWLTRRIAQLHLLVNINLNISSISPIS